MVEASAAVFDFANHRQAGYTMRTIENLWRYERQNQNSRQIAERAGRLYEKLRLFVEEMQQMGGSLHKAQESYDKAMGRLVNGRGNLIAQVERFRELAGKRFEVQQGEVRSTEGKVEGALVLKGKSS